MTASRSNRQPQMSMRSRAWLVLSGTWVVIALLNAAPQTKGISFRDKAGNMVVENLKSWKTTLVGESKITFVGSGNPLHGRWRDQGLQLKANKIEGTAIRNKEGAFELARALVSGGMVATIEEHAGRGLRTTTIRSTAVDYDAANEEATATGSVHVTMSDPGASQTFMINGSSATLQLSPKGSKSGPLRSGTLKGPVTFRLDSVRKDQGAPSGKRIVVITGRAASLAFNEANRTITLSGNVHLEGDDSVVAGTVDASSAVIRLNEKREVVEVELEGDPGTSTIMEKGGGR